MGDVYTGTGATIAISGPIDDTVDDATAFAALTWTPIGLAESLAEYGDESSAVNFTALSDGRVRKGKGARDAGTSPLVVAQDPTDAGQQALIAAEKTAFNYGFKITYPNKLDATGTNGIDYFRALVMSRRKSGAQTDNVARDTYSLGINSPIVEVAPTAGA